MSVDLDEIPHYHRIHGLAAPDPPTAHSVYDHAFERFLELSAELQIPLTFFLVAADTVRTANADRLKRAAGLGHELGNHSRDHFYDLVRRPAEEQRAQIAGALDLLEQNLGIRPQGFRAPGYTVTDQLLQIVQESGHLYDSSVFPCPPYYLAKAAAFAGLALRGRRSDAILDRPAVLRAPTRPYRIGRPYFQRGRGLLELPIQVTPGLRLPYLGTTLILAGKLGARALTELMVGEPFVNLELHGIDLLGRGDGLDALFGSQPDLRPTWVEKRSILSSVVARLKSAGYAFVTLGEVESALGGAISGPATRGSASTRPF